MRCSDVEALWDEMRCPEERGRHPIAVHLRACPDCQAVFKANDLLLDHLSQLREASPPADFTRRVLQHIRHACAPQRRTDTLAEIASPLGRLYVAFHEQGISYLAIDCGIAQSELMKRIERRLNRTIVSGTAPQWLLEAVSGYFTCWKIDPSRLDLSTLSEFESQALLTAARIPVGEVRSYGWIARELGRPNAARAVGQAMARNPLALFLPCHRVVDCTGSLHSYAYGIEYKARLLALEGYQVNEGSMPSRSRRKSAR